MAIKILMPALSPTMTEGRINNWLVNYAGPLPPSEFPNRVLNVVKKFI